MTGHLRQRLHEAHLLLRRDRAARRPMAMARQASTASWQVKAFVDATPISGPASVGSTASDLRAIVDVCTLTIAAMRWPCFLAVAQRGEAYRPSLPTARRTATAARGQGRLAVAHLGGDVDLDGDARVRSIQYLPTRPA